jgi:hypothetical protein
VAQRGRFTVQGVADVQQGEARLLDRARFLAALNEPTPSALFAAMARPWADEHAGSAAGVDQAGVEGVDDGRGAVAQAELG